MMNPKLNQTGGYVAIASLLVITVLITLIGSTVSLLGVDEGLTALNYRQGMDALALAQACAEEAILGITDSGINPETVELPIGDCQVVNGSVSGTLHQLTLIASMSGQTRQVYLKVRRGIVLQVELWQEN